MDKFLLYLLKVAALTGVFYLVYVLLFSRDTFYFRNRILLIIFLLLSIILPEIKIPVYRVSAATTFRINDLENMSLTTGTQAPVMHVAVNSFNYNRIFLILYIAIAVLLLIRAIISILSTYRIIRKGNLVSSRFPKIVLTDADLSPFSFYPYAVIPSKFYNSGKYYDILDHEIAHIQQGHTFDLLLAEFFIAFQWFNPFAWLIKRSVILNHEYLADKISLRNNTGIKEYQYRLLNFQTELKSISLAHNFNSLTKNRIIMINKKPTRRNATMKNLLILPAIAFGIYAFASPDYRNITPADAPLSINGATPILQKEIKGVVLNETGKPLEGVTVTSTGTMGHAAILKTDKDGRFAIMNADNDAMIGFFFQGYKEQSIKADFKAEMNVKMEKDPDYRNSNTASGDHDAKSKQLVVMDGAISKESPDDIISKMNDNVAEIRNLSGKEAIDKYGEKGKNGVVEIYSRKRAKEFGIKVPFRRTDPKDFPTFQGKGYPAFNDWVISQIKYPAEAAARGNQGHITANYTVETDGSINTVHIMGTSDQSLIDAVTKVIKSSPKWEPAKNPEVNEAFDNIVSIKFELPDKVEPDDVFVMSEVMPMYPGGDVELLKYIKDNTHYPEAAILSKKQGRVIVRFIVDTDGKAAEPTILKGIDPALDAEAIRIINEIKGFSPGSMGGKAVKVYYMAPVNFTLPALEPLFSKPSELEILKFMGSNTGYPQEAKNISDTGTVYVVVKINKGGVIKECNAFTQKSDVSAPFINEIVIVGFKPSSTSNSVNSSIGTSNDHAFLKTESLRVAGKLNELNLPEWKDNDIEFTIPIKYILK